MNLFSNNSRKFLAAIFLVLGLSGQNALAGDESAVRLAPGDTVQISVFQNPDLQVESRVDGNGAIDYPLVGKVPVGGLTVASAEQKLGQLLKQGGVEIDPAQLSLKLARAAEVSEMQAVPVMPAGDKGDYRLGSGDAIRISVFQNPDLSLEARISDSGSITYPLIGSVNLGGLTVAGAEQRLAQLLKEGGFVVDPQLSISLTQVRSSQVSLLGLVNRPGRYPLEQAKMKLTDVLALGGGVVPGAADSIVLVGMRDGQLTRKTIDVVSMILGGNPQEDVQIQNGDIIYVNKAAMFYIKGEVQRPGSYRIERDMTLMQALATGGGITQRGTERGIRVFRRDEKSGKVEKIELEMQDLVRPDDVIAVRESLF